MDTVSEPPISNAKCHNKRYMLASGRQRRSLIELAHPGWNAVVRNWRPFVAIQATAFAAVVAYYAFPALPKALAGVAEFKQNAGLPFAAISTALAGVVLPDLAKRLTLRRKSTWADLLFQGLLYATIGSFVDLLYRFLGLLLGSDPSFRIVLEKVLLDQLVFSPLVSMTVSTFAFLYRDEGFNLSKTLLAIREGEFLRRYPPLLVTCWGFWGPVLAAVYAMPANLQFILFLCAQGAWSLLLVAVADDHRPA